MENKIINRILLKGSPMVDTVISEVDFWAAYKKDPKPEGRIIVEGVFGETVTVLKSAVIGFVDRTNMRMPSPGQLGPLNS
jgi:hypothetical protein|tara:strand:+ start:542 stop:781 length:240 start_codon:yes stop_codon:yes gene_type:complete